MHILEEVNMDPLSRIGTHHCVNTKKVINFSFDGTSYKGVEGDTLASALLANGVKIIGRSFKLHRPRGLLAAGREEPNALMQLESGAYTEPNARATTTPLYDNLKAYGQNAWPSVENDMLSILGHFQKLLPASFYYKSMMKPSWHFYEGIVRNLAGLGKSPEKKDEQSYVKRNVHCDVLVIGGGPAGISAALSASNAGHKVIIADEQETLGGSLQGEICQVQGSSSKEWLSEKLSQLHNSSNIKVLPRTCVVGYFEHNFLTATERVSNHLGPKAGNNSTRERMWRIRAQKVIIATGAMERPLVFPDNDTPGIMLCDSVTQYLLKYGVVCGDEIVVVTNNDSAYRNAITLAKLGVKVKAIVDSRKNVNQALIDELSVHGIDIVLEAVISKVIGQKTVKEIEISRHLGDGQVGEKTDNITCNLVAMSGGWTPTVHLFSQAGGSLYFDYRTSCFVPKSCQQNTQVVGSANGTFSIEASIQEGINSGKSLTQISEQLQNEEDAIKNARVLNIEPYWYLKNLNTEKQWIDFQYDVKVSDIELATRENFTSVEHLKRYTTNGMSIDQGKTSNINALAVMAELSGRKIPQVGTTKFRPPFHPATIGAFAGRDVGKQLAPIAKMPAHEWHVEHGGKMEDMGWLRPEYYLQPNEDEHAAIKREVLAVRNSVGMFDGSPIGKIEVKGPDAATFLNRIYVNNAASLKLHRARYGLMTNENGIVIDDGVFVRLNEDHFLCHTTSGGATRITQWMEEWLQCEWPDLNVIVNNVTTQWACIAVSGPNTRKVLSGLDTDINFLDADFKHMQYREGFIGGVPTRVLRASFSGEVTFEISVPANYGLDLWKKIYKLGRSFDITPYGVESLMVLRCEKGYLHVGADTDGTTNPLDLGWFTPISKKVDDFIGKRSLSRPNDQGSERLQFIGLEALNSKDKLPIGGHFIDGQSSTMPIKSQGYCTSACLSPTLNKSVGLGLLSNGQKRIGEHVVVYSNGQKVAAKVVSPTHFDPAGEKLNG